MPIPSSRAATICYFHQLIYYFFFSVNLLVIIYQTNKKDPRGNIFKCAALSDQQSKIKRISLISESRAGKHPGHFDYHSSILLILGQEGQTASVRFVSLWGHVSKCSEVFDPVIITDPVPVAKSRTTCPVVLSSVPLLQKVLNFIL